MKGKVVRGEWKAFDEETISLEVERGEEKEYPHDLEFDEERVKNLLGEFIKAIIINGKVKRIRKEEEPITSP